MTGGLHVSWGDLYDPLAEVARAVFAKESPLIDRKIHTSFRAQVERYAALDWLSISDPHSQDPDAPGLGSIAAIHVELGRALVATPLVALGVARDTLLLAGTASAHDLANAIGDGATTAVLVADESAWGTDPLIFDDERITGTALGVAYADEADRLVVAIVGDEPVLLEVERSSVSSVTDMRGIGAEPLSAVVFDGVKPTRVLANGDDVTTAVSQARARGAVLRAAQIAGAGEALLAMTLEYANTRQQFGGPIGRFQAVQYLCTDVAIAGHLTSLFARDAASALDRGESPELRVAIMRRHAAIAAQEMVHCAHEVHAGAGYMIESNVPLFTKAAKGWQFEMDADGAADARIVRELEKNLKEMPYATR